MIPDIREIEHKALTLSPEQRGKLIRTLILSLDTEDMDQNVEEQWIKESKRRISDFKEGKTEGIPFPDVIKKAREQLK